MMRIIPRGPDAYLFRDGSHASVGWLRARTVRFTGFLSRRDAVAAAVQGGLSLAAFAGGTARHIGPGVARPPDTRGGTAGEGERGVRVEHDGSYEWVHIDSAAVARLVPPADAGAVAQAEEVLACGDGSVGRPASETVAFCVEFLLAEHVGLDACLTIAQVLFAAVEPHRARRGGPARPRDEAPPARRPAACLTESAGGTRGGFVPRDGR